MQISDQISLHLTPLGFARETDCDSADEKFLLLFAKKDYKATEALSPFVTTALWFEYLFYINDLYRAQDVVLSCKKWPKLSVVLLSHLCCAQSNQPALVFEAHAFVRSLSDGRTHPLFEHRDGLLEPAGAERLHVVVARVGAGVVCVRSPSRSRVYVYQHSMEYTLCNVARWGFGLPLSTLELFSGAVAPPLLAEALFARGELKAFDAMLASFPACADYIRALAPISNDGHKGQVEDMQAHVRVLQARQAALQALGELV